jgi:hypothetical protein
MDYFLFYNNLTYNFYIRNYPYFFEFTSHRKYFIKYNNPTSTNKGQLHLWAYKKLLGKNSLSVESDIINKFNFTNIRRIEPFSGFFNRRDNNNSDFVSNLILKDFNIRLFLQLKNSKTLLNLMNKFFNFNLIEFSNLKYYIEGYSEVMAIKSVYEYRFSNSSFKNINDFMSSIFKTKVENILFFEENFKIFNYDIIFNIYKGIEKVFFFKDLFNCNNLYYKFNSSSFKFFNKLFDIYIYVFESMPF